MTAPIDEINCTKQVPEIEMEEDIPFPAKTENDSTTVDQRLDKTDDLNKRITMFRYKTGGKVLYISMAAMGITVVVDLIASSFGGNNELVVNAFEAFKLITMTVLGYIFGSSNTQS